jgi:hypothetical protein
VGIQSEQQSVNPFDGFLDDLPSWPGGTPPRARQTVKIDPLQGLQGKKFPVAGTMVELFTVGQLAKVLGRKAVTIRAWESQGTLPGATFRSAPPCNEQLPGRMPVGRRLYSRDQVELILSAIALYQIGTKYANWSEFTKHITEHWKQTP